MSRERNEHSVESGIKGMRKGYIYISALLFQIYKYKKMGQWYRYHFHRYQYRLCKKWQWPIGTGTALTGTDTARQILGKLEF